MTPHIDAPPHAAVDELPMVHEGLLGGAVVATMTGLDLHPALNFEGEKRRSSNNRRSGNARRGDEDRRGDNGIHSIPRRIRDDRRERIGIGGRRATD